MSRLRGKEWRNRPRPGRSPSPQPIVRPWGGPGPDPVCLSVIPSGWSSYWFSVRNSSLGYDLDNQGTIGPTIDKESTSRTKSQRHTCHRRGKHEGKEPLLSFEIVLNKFAYLFISDVASRFTSSGIDTTTRRHSLLLHTALGHGLMMGRRWDEHRAAHQAIHLLVSPQRRPRGSHSVCPSALISGHQPLPRTSTRHDVGKVAPTRRKLRGSASSSSFPFQFHYVVSKHAVASRSSKALCSSRCSGRLL